MPLKLERIACSYNNRGEVTWHKCICLNTWNHRNEILTILILVMINKLSIVNKKVIEVTTLAHKQILNIMEMNIASYSTTMHHYDLHKKFDNIEISI